MTTTCSYKTQQRVEQVIQCTPHLSGPNNKADCGMRRGPTKKCSLCFTFSLSSPWGLNLEHSSRPANPGFESRSTNNEPRPKVETKATPIDCNISSHRVPFRLLAKLPLVNKDSVQGLETCALTRSRCGRDRRNVPNSMWQLTSCWLSRLGVGPQTTYPHASKS